MLKCERSSAFRLPKVTIWVPAHHCTEWSRKKIATVSIRIARFSPNCSETNW